MIFAPTHPLGPRCLIALAKWCKIFNSFLLVPLSLSIKLAAPITGVAGEFGTIVGREIDRIWYVFPFVVTIRVRQCYILLRAVALEEGIGWVYRRQLCFNADNWFFRNSIARGRVPERCLFTTCILYIRVSHGTRITGKLTRAMRDYDNVLHVKYV